VLSLPYSILTTGLMGLDGTVKVLIREPLHSCNTHQLMNSDTSISHLNWRAQRLHLEALVPAVPQHRECERSNIHTQHSNVIARE
jgi:hypothetical protein